MTSTDPRADRALFQIDLLTSALGFLVLALLLLGGAVTAWGSGSILGVGDPEVCAAAAPGEVPWSGRDARSAVPGLEADARWRTSEISVCVEDPGPGLRLAASLRGLLELVTLVGFLFLVRRIVRHARLAGLFAEGVESRVLLLGRFLVVAAPASAFLGQLGDHLLLDAAVAGELGYGHLFEWDFPWTLFIVGVGLVSTGKVLAYARLLQDDVDGTI